MNHPAALAGSNFSSYLGVQRISADADEVVYELPVTSQLINRNGVLHGGALMALIDNTAGTLALMNCPEGRTTVTVEAKTNFFRYAREGDVVRAVARPLHAGRTTLVAQVSTTRGDGKELSGSMQTLLFIEWSEQT